MSDEAFVIPASPFLSEEERVELDGVFARFAAAAESPDEDSFDRFFAEEQPFFDSATEMQNTIFMMTMVQLGLISEEEAAAALSGDDLDAVIYDEDVDEFDILVADEYVDEVPAEDVEFVEYGDVGYEDTESAVGLE